MRYQRAFARQLDLGAPPTSTNTRAHALEPPSGCAQRTASELRLGARNSNARRGNPRARDSSAVRDLAGAKVACASGQRCAPSLSLAWLAGPNHSAGRRATLLQRAPPLGGPRRPTGGTDSTRGALCAKSCRAHYCRRRRRRRRCHRCCCCCRWRRRRRGESSFRGRYPLLLNIESTTGLHPLNPAD